MPFYEYQCQACGEPLEVLQKINDPLLVDCPACEKPALKKKMSAAAFRLKGGGWYETDFKDKGQRNVAESGNGADGKDKAAGESGGKSENKSEKKTDTEKKDTKGAEKSSSSSSPTQSS